MLNKPKKDNQKKGNKKQRKGSLLLHKNQSNKK